MENFCIYNQHIKTFGLQNVYRLVKIKIMRIKYKKTVNIIFISKISIQH